jgi:hypothetical protein
LSEVGLDRLANVIELHFNTMYKTDISFSYRYSLTLKSIQAPLFHSFYFLLMLLFSFPHFFLNIKMPELSEMVFFATATDEC